MIINMWGVNVERWLVMEESGGGSSEGSWRDEYRI